jgi:hypothetical protein
MGFFNNLKGKLFPSGKKEEVKQVEQPIAQADIPSPVDKKLWVCEACKGTIDVGERWSKFNGSWYHKICFKKLKRMGYNSQ